MCSAEFLGPEYSVELNTSCVFVHCVKSLIKYCLHDNTHRRHDSLAGRSSWKCVYASTVGECGYCAITSASHCDKPVIKSQDHRIKSLVTQWDKVKQQINLWSWDKPREETDYMAVITYMPRRMTSHHSLAGIVPGPLERHRRSCAAKASWLDISGERTPVYIQRTPYQAVRIYVFIITIHLMV